MDATQILAGAEEFVVEEERMRANRVLRKLGPLSSLVAAAIVAGCGSSSQQPGGTEPEQVELSFTSSETEVEQGGSVILSWTSRNADSLRLLAGNVPLALDDAGIDQGSIEVSPVRTTRYRLEATGARGATVSRELDIRVIERASHPPAITAFTATPEVFGVNQPVRLAWETSGAAALSLRDDAGRPIDLGSLRATGEVELFPLSSSTYTLLATNAAGEASASVSVTLVPKPLVSLSASEREIPLGASIVLRWELEGAGELALWAGDEPAPILQAGPDEELPTELELTPAQSTRYRLEARGPGGVSEATEWVAVRPVIETFAADVDAPTRPGLLVPLRWSMRGASSATISNRSGWSFEVPEAALSEGGIEAPTGLGGSFVLVARSGGLESLPANILVPLTSEPRIVDLRFEPEGGITAGRGELGEARLSWVVEGAEGALLLDRIPGGPVDLVAVSNRRGEVDLVLEGPTRLRLTARNTAGEHQVELQAPVVQPPAVQTFKALPARVGVGETVELSWEVEDAVEVRVERDGVVVAGPGAAIGSFSEPIAASTTYTLRSINSLGFEGPARSLTVEVGAPEIVGFRASSEWAQPGSQVRFDWSSSGGDLLELSTAAGEIHRVSDLAAIESGFVYLDVPEAVGDHLYTLRVTNGSGSAEEQLVVRVTGLPVVTSLTVTPSELLVGRVARFAWTVADGVGGEKPILELRDEEGVLYPLTPEESALGEKHLAIETAGERTFTLYAIEETSSERTSASVGLRAYGHPEVVALVASPPFAEVQNQEVQIAWETSNAARALLWALSPEGTSGPLLCEATGGEAAEGSCTIRVSKEWPDVRLEVEHAFGASTEQVLRIGVRPATVLTFEADPLVIPRGSSTTLRWETRFADVVELGPKVVETDEPYLDLRSLGGSPLNFTSSGSRILAFPEGFSFPYFGREVREICVSAQGMMSLEVEWLNCYIDPIFGGSPNAFAYDRVDFGVFFHPRIGRPIPAIPEQDGFWRLHTEADGKRSLIIQWSGFGFSDSATVGPYNLNFQAHLHEDGRIEYRYGAMECAGTSCAASSEGAARAAGYGQIVGFHAPPEALPRYAVHLIPPRTEMPGGFGNRSFTFYPGNLAFARSLEAEGTLSISPTKALELTLFARNEHSADQRTLRLEVHDYASIGRVSAAPSEPVPLEPFTLEWNAFDTLRLEISTDEVHLLETEDPAVISGGRLEVSGLPAGIHELTFRAFGRFGDNVERKLELRIFPPYGIERFEAAPILSGAAGEEVVLSWEAYGLQSLEIHSTGEAVVLPPTVDLDGDSIRVHPAESTTYTLVGESFGRIASVSTSVSVRSARLDAMTVPDGIHWDGTPVTVSWSGSGKGLVSITQTPVSNVAGQIYSSPDLPEWEEVTAEPGTAFVDISSLPGTVTYPFASANDVAFPEGFSFPFGGAYQTSLRALLHGGLTFNPSQGNGLVTSRLPIGTAASTRIHLVPFGQGLSECIRSSRLDDAGDPFIIQYSGCNSAINTAKPALYEFQVALFRNGDIEFRYGTMTAADITYANGAQASIGWQDLANKLGRSLTFREAIEGGLSGRSWRAKPMPLAGSFTVVPSQTTTFEICVFNGTWRECEQGRVEVVARNSVLPTEFMPNPVGGGPKWIEIRSLLQGDLDLRGAWIQFLISGEFTRHQITGPDPVILPGKGGYMVLSDAPMEGLPPGVTNYVFGPDLVITPGAGNDYRLLNPALTMNIGGAAWNWTFAPGKSQELSGTAQIYLGATTFPQSLWCPTTTSYDASGNTGTPGRGGASCGTAGAAYYDVDWYAGDRFIDLRPLVGEGAVAFPALATANPAGATLEYPGGLPFAFPFFGETLPAGQTLSISSNGFTSFGTLASAYASRPTGKLLTSPAAPAEGLLAPFFSYLTGAPGSSFEAIATRVEGMEVLGLQWSNFTKLGAEGRLTFQVQLWENGDIVFAYSEVPPAVGGDVKNVGIQSRVSPAAQNIPMAQTALFSGRSIVFKKK